MIFIAVIVLVSWSALMAWLTAKSVRTGIVYRPWPQMKRDDGPIWFWINVGGLVVIGLAAAAFALFLVYAKMAG